MIKSMQLGILFLTVTAGLAQDKNEVKLAFSGYLESYYAYDFNRPNTPTKLPFMYNYNRHNEFNVNIGLVRVKAEYENVYASLALHSGTYVEDNYANETTKIINEAFIGLYLDEAKKSSVEVGILPSYIGFESATTSANLTLTRSMLAENSPYFMTGVKYTYKPNNQWQFSGLVTNGWQRIDKPDKNISPALGYQIVFKPKENSTFNWSTFMGKELYNGQWGMRYFSNGYWDKQWNAEWRTITGFDFGWQTNVENGTKLFWMSPVFIAQYAFDSKWQTAIRLEYYQDKHNVIVATTNGFSTFGTSLNLDYLINSKVKFRTEAKYFNSQHKVFVYGDDVVKTNFSITTGLAFEF